MTKLYMARGGQTALFPRAKPTADNHANRGMELEHELMVMHQLYKRQKLAVVEKNYIKTQPVTGGEWARIIGKAIVDFTGTLAGGRSVAFDAKDCVERRIELNRLDTHQAEYLGSVYALGGLAFVLARFERKHCYKIPIDVWADAVLYWKFGKPVERVDGWKPKNKASLTMADMRTEWAIKGVDWLGVDAG